MKQSHISFEQSHAFNQFFLDYINGKESLKRFYGSFPKIENFKQQIESKSKAFSKESRNRLTDVLTQQYQGLPLSESVKNNLASLREAKTFTVITGHQLNIFTGPLYFIYKIATVVNACKQLKQAYPDCAFVPVYWMASEDHDFEEISYFKLYGKKYVWKTEQTGAVGRFSTDSLKSLLTDVPGEIGVFKEAYTKQKTLSGAVRQYVNQLFGDEGVVVLDADDRELKKSLAPVMHDDVFKHTAKNLVEQTNKALEQEGYSTQVFARDINFFFLPACPSGGDKGYRERLERRENGFALADGSKKFSDVEMETIIRETPEQLSPNVILRPLYQEMILPNLAYVGGPAENVYWLQLKSVFDHFKTPFPILLPRNFAMVMDGPSARKFSKTGMELSDLFLQKSDLLNQFVRKHSGHKLQLNRERATLEMFFNLISQDSEKIDKSLGPLVAAEWKRTFNSLSKIERKLLQAEKRFQSDKLRQMEEVKDALFPNGSLQERTDNFLNFYQQDPQFIKKILGLFDPFDFRMNIFRYDEAGT
jgi:bacillithiol biosynthesis cysteine-adding enzyme BshC